MDEIVEEIHKYVTEQDSKVAEESVQRLYASEEALQKMYAAKEQL